MSKSESFDGYDIIIYVTALFLLFSSCKQYGDKIVNTFPSQQGVYRVLDSVTIDSARHNLVQIDSAHVGNPLVYTMYYTIEPSFPQKLSVAKHNGTLWIGILFIVLALASAGLGFYYTINVPKWKLAPVALGFLCVIWLWCFGGAVDWAHTKEATIPVWQYEKEIHENGNLSQFWSTHLYN